MYKNLAGGAPRQKVAGQAKWTNPSIAEVAIGGHPNWNIGHRPLVHDEEMPDDDQ